MLVRPEHMVSRNSDDHAHRNKSWIQINELLKLNFYHYLVKYTTFQAPLSHFQIIPVSTSSTVVIV